MVTVKVMVDVQVALVVFGMLVSSCDEGTHSSMIVFCLYRPTLPYEMLDPNFLSEHSYSPSRDNL